MLEFAILAVTFVVSLMCTGIYLYPSSKSLSTVPGLDPASKEDGNLSDIAKAGSLHEFLLDLHKQFGPIASFWWGPRYVVSIANADLFKEHHNVFDRPPELFELFELLIGPKCIQYANGEDGITRRYLYDKCLTYGAIRKYLITFQEIADELAKKWETMLNDEHIPVTQFMSAFALKSVLASLFGEKMKDDKEILEYKRVYDVTPVIHALGVASKDETIFPQPDKFDPNRFTHGHARKRPHLAFSPFGFAGKRVCPGQRFAYAEAVVALVTLQRKFKVKMVDGQVIKPVHGFVTHPSEEIWITISKR